MGSFVRLGWRRRAAELLEFLMADRRPPEWNHWAEVVWPRPREPKFIGDMPHGWVGSDFIRSFLDLFAYARESDEALVLGAGLPVEWLRAPSGVSVATLGTPYGPLDLKMSADGGVLRIGVSGLSRVPPGGLVVPWPLEGRPSSATINGRAARLSAGGEIVAREIPAEIVVRGEESR